MTRVGAPNRRRDHPRRRSGRYGAVAEGDGLADAAGDESPTEPSAGAPPGSPGTLYSAFHAEPDGSVDSVAGETPWLTHLAW